MGKENDEKKEDEKLIPVGDGVESPDTEGERSEAPEDEKISHAADDSSDEDDEEGADGDERERIRARRRREKQNRARRIQLDRKELDFLRKRNESLERQFSQIHLRQEKLEETTVDGRIGDLESKIREAETIHSQAIESKDGATATEALRVKGELEKIRDDLKEGKKERAEAREERKQVTAQQRETPQVDPEAVVQGREWCRANPWFDPKLGDEDSFLARAIEERMAREGEFDPRDPEYWQELNRRIDKRLPGLRKQSKKAVDNDEWEEDDDKPQPAKKKPSGPRIAVGGKTRALKPNEVFLSKERVAALKEAGVWEDDERRERYLKAYRKYDEDAASRNS